MNWLPFETLRENRDARGKSVVFLFENEHCRFTHCAYVAATGWIQTSKHDAPVWRHYPGNPLFYCILPDIPQEKPSTRVETTKGNESKVDLSDYVKKSELEGFAKSLLDQHSRSIADGLINALIKGGNQ